MKRTNLALGAGAMALFMSAAPMALAQTTPTAPPPPPPPPAADSGQGPIVVTALRQATNIQKTPVQVTALGAQKLKDSASIELRDITTLVPSVRYSAEAAGEYTSVSMRGIGTSAAGGSGPSVLEYFEEVPMAGAALNLNPYDLQDVQVLQGPQGTSFGRNTIAGAVLLEPVLPGFTQNGYIKGSYGNYNYAEIEGAFNATVIPDVLALRFGGYYQRRDPTVRALSPAGGPSTVLGRQNNLNGGGFRFSALFTPTPNIRNVTTFDYVKENTSGLPSVLIDPVKQLTAAVAINGGNTLAAAMSLGYPSYAAAQAGTQALAACNHHCIDYGNLTQPFLFFHDETYRLFNTTTWDITPNIQAKNIFGYQATDSSVGENSAGNIFHNFIAQSATPAQTLTEEFQVRGHFFNDRVNAVVGVFYTNVDANGVSALNIPFLLSQSPPGPFNLGIEEGTAAKSNSLATYFNVSAKLTDKVTFRGGFRYTWDYLESCSGAPIAEASIPLPGTIPTASAPFTTVAECYAKIGNPNPLIASAFNSKHSAAPTWEMGLDFQATDDLFFYVVSRRGYRAQALNSNYSDPCLNGAPSIYAGASTGQVITNPTSGTNGQITNPGGCNNDSGVQASLNRNNPLLSTTPVASGHSINLVPLAVLGAETLTDVEVGARTQWTMGSWRARFNIDYFHYWDNNIGVLLLLGATTSGAYDLEGGPTTPACAGPPNTCSHTGGTAFGGVTATAGSVVTDGVQGDLTLFPTPNLTFDVNFSWVHQTPSPVALPASFFAGMTPTEIANLKAPGSQELGQLASPTPEWAFNVSMKYILPWHPLDGDLAFNYEYFWTGMYFEQNTPVAGYDLHNLRLDWNNIGRSNVSAGIWVRNLLDKAYIIGLVNLGAGSVNYSEPRMIGVDVSYKFH